ncbi:MAG: DISARM system helicase DrmA [Verrucomicrobiota bacterium]
MTASQQVRSALVETIELDLVGPRNDHPFAHELLPQSPQRWYLTGYLVPQSADEKDRKTDEEEFVPEVATGVSGDDNDEVEPQVQVSYLPSSMGLSVLVGPQSTALSAVVRWGDYFGENEEEGAGDFDPSVVDREHEEEMAKQEDLPTAEAEGLIAATLAQIKPTRKRPRRGFRREPREEDVPFTLEGDDGVKDVPVPNSRGLKLVVSWTSLPHLPETGLPAGTKTVSVFVVNDRPSSGVNGTFRDIAFQVELELANETGFYGRPDLRGAAFPEETDHDELIADLHYRDVLEYAVGHGVATVADNGGSCHVVRTTWIPSAEVPRVDHADKETIGAVELSMERLGELVDLADAKTCLGGVLVSYRTWITVQETALTNSNFSSKQKATTGDLIIGAKVAADRIEEGIQSLANPQCLEAFRIANRAMARAARQRFAVQQGIAPAAMDAPRWRAFQLAFILINLNGLFDPRHSDRKVVDLLFFPTGGGKTEAYLGLSAFTVVLRRLQNPGIDSAGVSIIMRYTLRLLTLDQLGRAAALMCALELERAGNKALGEWPFEIGLWVGAAATPNRMGKANDDSPGKDDTAYAKLTKFRNNPRKHPAPIPMEECPWCGTRFVPDCFHLEPPGAQEPRDLRVACDNMHCEFSAANNDSWLPILGVDEPIYRRLPCFLIATVDKFAALPWMGRTGALFGNVDRFDGHGFYGPCDTGKGSALSNGRLLPPDLIIQDELHLISGPLGTVAGIYETAIEELCKRDLGEGLTRLPKIIASTATVRRADRQIRALFGREQTAIFPPPGPDRTDSFFARTIPSSPENPGRLYLGVAAQGRSMKVVLLRTSLALLAGAEQLYHEAGGKRPDNPCDPYMTLLSYFNSLRELGGSRRIVEDEVYVQAQSRWKRRRREPQDDLFRSRYINRNPVELTSRVSTDEVANAKRRLSADFSKDDKVDVALATNMISVGLDIVRLGLMVVLGQPKTTSEYIQATSRVGRDKNKPGLVVTLLNSHKPRDRSHYERFGIYHRTFYRAVEATSVTPFSPRALDRALAGALVGLCRHILSDMEAPTRAGNVQSHLPALQQAIRVFSQRAKIHDVDKASTQEGANLAAHVDALAQNLIAKWAKIASECASDGSALTYQKFEGPRQGDALIRDFLDSDLLTKPPIYRNFRANRSMRDVEPAVDILPLKSSTGTNR